MLNPSRESRPRGFHQSKQRRQEVLHYVSDFRETRLERLDQDLTRIDGLLAKGTFIYLIDTAFPERKDSQPMLGDPTLHHRSPADSGWLPVNAAGGIHLSIAHYTPSELKALNYGCSMATRFKAPRPSQYSDRRRFKHKFELACTQGGLPPHQRHIKRTKSGLIADNYRPCHR